MHVHLPPHVHSRIEEFAPWDGLYDDDEGNISPELEDKINASLLAKIERELDPVERSLRLIDA